MLTIACLLMVGVVKVTSLLSKAGSGLCYPGPAWKPSFIENAAFPAEKLTFIYLSIYLSILLYCPQASTQPQFDSFVLLFFYVLRVTAYHAKLSSRTELQLFWHASGTMTSGIKVSHIPVHSLVHSVLCLQYQIRITTSNECYRRLAMRLQVSPLSSMMQFIHHRW